MRTSSNPLPPGSVIGILGGGQLGRMLSQAAARLGYRSHIYLPPDGANGDVDEAPAVQVSETATCAAWDDVAALTRFARTCDVVTYEFENIPPSAADSVARHGVLRPSAAVLATCQDRIQEKTFLAGQGVPIARWRAVSDADALRRAIGEIGFPAVLKTARLGYDGKGQAAIRDVADLAAWKETTAQATGAVVEEWIDFVQEISVVVARSVTGETTTYVPVENQHENHILRRTIAPAAIAPGIAASADALARRIAIALDLVGVLAVEMFVCHDGRVLVNELAPRPHNSGHWTLDACVVSQFEQCIRAIVGLPLGSTDRHADAVMENLLGEDVDRWRELAADPRACLHIYGKRETRPGRKMGHVTWLVDDASASRAFLATASSAPDRGGST